MAQAITAAAAAPISPAFSRAKTLVDIKAGISFDQIVANQIGKADALPVARTRHGRRAPGRRLRFRLLLRLHQQSGLAQRNAAAAARSSIRARCSSASSAPDVALSPEARARQNRYRRSILDFVTDDTQEPRSQSRPHRQAQAGRVSLLHPRDRTPDRKSRKRQRADRSRTWKSPTASQPISPSTSS